MRFMVLMAILLTGLNLSLELSAQDNPDKMPDRGDLIEDLLIQYYELHQFNGALLVAEDNAVLFENTLGFADLSSAVPLDAEIPFYLASLSKQFTAAAIMKLSEEGKINLYDPLRNYLPQLPQIYTEVKIVNLLNHTSGIPDYLNSSVVSEGITNQEVFQYLMRIRRLDFTPGNKFRYSNSGYVLLAMIIEMISGQSIDLYFAETFFNPLAMRNTFVFTTDAAFRSRVFGFDERNKKQDYTLLTVGDGGIYSTTTDLFLWVNALNNGQVLSSESLQAMYTPVRLKSGREKRYGYGWELGNDRGGSFVYHSGQLAGFRIYLEHQNSTGKTIIILTNNNFARIADLRNQLVKILDGRITKIPEE